MSPTSSTLLLFGLLLSFSILNLSKSEGEKWETFKRNHIASSPVINCDVVMAGECREMQSFIHTQPSVLENFCKGITGSKNYSRSKEFKVSTCEKEWNASCTYQDAEVQIGPICLTCRNGKPVQLVQMGKC